MHLVKPDLTMELLPPLPCQHTSSSVVLLFQSPTLIITAPRTNLGPDQVSLSLTILCIFLFILIYCNLSEYDPALSPSAANPRWLCVSYKLDKQTCWVSIQAIKSKCAQDKAKDKGPILPNADSPTLNARPPALHSRPLSVPTTNLPTAGSWLPWPQRSLQRGHFLLLACPTLRQAQPFHNTLCSKA